MTKAKTKKTVFAVINLAKTEKEQLNVARYAAKLAKHLGYSVVLYPKSHNNNMVLTDIKRNFLLATKIAYQINKDIDVRVARKESTLFTSVNDIAKIERAAIIVIEIDKSVRFLGESMWKTTQKSRIPIILLPKDFVFTSLKRITIAVDAERKVQKTKIVTTLAKAFASTINIFVDLPMEKPHSPKKTFLIKNVLQHIEANLKENGVPFIVEEVRKPTKYFTRLCKYSAKHSDLLVVEVDRGTIDSVIEQNIKTLLSIQNYTNRIPVMLTKTKEMKVTRLN